MDFCQHSNSRERRRTKSNGVEVISVQCLDCGVSLREVSKVGRDLSVLEAFDDSFLKRQNEELDRIRTTAMIEQQQKSNEWWRQYNSYLKSDHWKMVRDVVLRRDQVCQKCFKVWAEQAHHLSYATFNEHGFSFPHECVGICGECHKQIHPEMI